MAMELEIIVNGGSGPARTFRTYRTDATPGARCCGRHVARGHAHRRQPFAQSRDKARKVAANGVDVRKSRLWLASYEYAVGLDDGDRDVCARSSHGLA